MSTAYYYYFILTVIFVYIQIKNQALFQGLLKWTKPQTQMKDFGASLFNKLLPADLDNNPQPGDIFLNQYNHVL